MRGPHITVVVVHNPYLTSSKTEEILCVCVCVSVYLFLVLVGGVSIKCTWICLFVCLIVCLFNFADTTSYSAGQYN